MKSFIKKNNLGEYIKNASFKSLTSMKVGGKIKGLIYPNDYNSLYKILKKLKKKRYFIIGNGTNLVPSDEYYRGYVISLKRISPVYVESENHITVSSNYYVSQLAIKMVNSGYSGYAFLGGIPGTVGGAVVMNAGAYNSSISDYFVEASVIDGGVFRTIKKEEMAFSYRKSILTNSKMTVVSVTFSKGEKKPELAYKLKEWKRLRGETQPLDYPSCGSIFKNHENYKAWNLIDLVNLRGYKIGDASFSVKHANFIINHGNAKANDIYELVNLAKRRVFEKMKIFLETEVIFFNFKKL